MRPINSIIIHHSATENETVESIRKYHIEHNGWSDIGYHYVIEASGETKEGRNVLIQGAHCYGQNKTSIGICLPGKNKFTAKQIFSLIKLIKLLMRVYNIKKENVHGHNEYSKKECPSFDVHLLREFL